jgi:voltage-gated potassium channel
VGEHVIVCGAGTTTGGYIVDELIKARSLVVAVDTDQKALDELFERHPVELLRCVIGDPTDEDVLADAGLATARGVVTTLPNDKDNIYVIVEARLQNPSVRIIATASEKGHVEKIRKVGADGIVNPGYIGGLRIVSEMIRPDVVRFLDDMLRDKSSVMRIEEAHVEAGSKLEGTTLRDAGIRTHFGMSVLAIGVDGRDGRWIYNPEATEKLVAGSILVVLGSVEQVAELRAAGRAPER